MASFSYVPNLTRGIFYNYHLKHFGCYVRKDHQLENWFKTGFAYSLSPSSSLLLSGWMKKKEEKVVFRT